MLYLGIICLLYYICICAVMRKWNSTFSRFWLVAGSFFVFIHWFMNPVLKVFFVAIVTFFLCTEMMILQKMFLKPKDELKYVIVLGAKVNGTMVSESLRRRLDRTLTYMKENPNTKAIVSGSQLGGEVITEAEAMKRYLVEAGIDENRIIKEENSYTTEQNLRFSKELIPDIAESVGIITSNYHVYRAICYAKKLGYQEVHGISASTHPVLLINYLVREFFAILKLFLLTIKFTML